MGDTSGPNWILEIPIPLCLKGFNGGVLLRYLDAMLRLSPRFLSANTRSDHHVRKQTKTPLALTLHYKDAFTHRHSHAHLSPWRDVAKQQEAAPPFPSLLHPFLFLFFFLISFFSAASIRGKGRERQQRDQAKAIFSLWCHILLTGNPVCPCELMKICIVSFIKVLMLFILSGSKLPSQVHIS